jgi:hypothetical protein
MKNLSKQFYDMIIKHTPGITKLDGKCVTLECGNIEHTAITLSRHDDGTVEIAKYRWIQDIYDNHPPKGGAGYELACIRLGDSMSFESDEFETVIKLAELFKGEQIWTV